MPVRGTYRKTAGRREDILDAATRIFASRGFHAGSLRDVAAQAGMSHAGLLHHFPSKEHLLIEVLRRRDERDAAIALAGAGDTITRLAEVMAANSAEPDLMSLYAWMSVEAIDPAHPARTYMLQRDAMVRTTLAANLSDDMDAGVLPRGDDALLARELIAVMDGLQSRWLIGRDFDLAEAVEAAGRALTGSERA